LAWAVVEEIGPRGSGITARISR